MNFSDPSAISADSVFDKVFLNIFNYKAFVSSETGETLDKDYEILTEQVPR